MNRSSDGTACIIMAGGAGTRFWPLSTETRPKQFLKLFSDDRSLLQKSLDRVSDLFPNDRILVLTSKDFVEMVSEELPQIPRENIVGEPYRRDTAAAVCLGALICRERFGNPVIATLTADHMIEPEEVFRKTLSSALKFARKEAVLYTFGIHPTYPATGYGYLELGRKIIDDEGIEHYELLRFKEKPDLETARGYLESGRFKWNSGMFVWTAEAILREIERHIPAHLEALSEATTYLDTPRWPEALGRAFASIETVSIDYAVMERAETVRCVGCTFSWSDVGGWNAMKAYLPGDDSGNHSRGRLMNMDARDNLVFCENKDESVMLIGVRDLVVVRAGDKTLVTHKDRTEDIKKVLKKYSL
ncbi:MAG: NTP transferase domain-containing protein [Deltaproteobacteria bacterium]|nr:NTP transferase domain-containing protein [Deltaproteobacteria bacterium]